MFGVLTPDLVRRKAVVPAAPLVFLGGLQAQLFTVPGKVPLYLEGDKAESASETAANVGVELYAGDARIVYIPGAAAVTAAIMARIKEADVVFFDGTLFRDDEMITTNPVLVAGSPERVRVEREGWEIAEDGMEIAL